MSIERIEEYLDPLNIRGSLEGASLASSEVETATTAIQHERAQFVVDSVAFELRSRLSDIQTRREVLIGELSILDEEQQVIDSALDRQSRINLSELAISPLRHERLTEVAKATNKKDFIELMSTEPAFTLWLKKKGSIDPWNFDYAGIHADEIGLSLSRNISKSFGALARAYVFSTFDQSTRLSSDEEARQREFWGVGNIERDEEGSVVSITVAEPVTFFENALYLNNFGLQSAKAVLAVAYHQRYTKQKDEQN